MSIIVWLILGLIAGFIGSKIINKSGEAGHPDSRRPGGRGVGVPGK